MRFRFRAILILSLLLVLLTTVGLVGGAFYLNARYLVEDLGSKVLVQTSKRVEQHIGKALSVAEYHNVANANLILGEVFPYEDHEAQTAYFLQTLQAEKSLSYLSFGRPTGKYWHVYRDRQGTISALWLLPQASGDRRLYEFVLEPDGSRRVIRDIAKSTRTPCFDRPYFKTAVAAESSVWTETYVFLGSGEELDIPGVSRVTAVRDQGAVLGVLTADFDLFALSRSLREIQVGKAGIAFLIEAREEGGGEGDRSSSGRGAGCGQAPRIDRTGSWRRAHDPGRRSPRRCAYSRVLDQAARGFASGSQ